jgi:hypothetical protein
MPITKEIVHQYAETLRELTITRKTYRQICLVEQGHMLLDEVFYSNLELDHIGIDLMIKEVYKYIRDNRVDFFLENIIKNDKKN